MPALADLFKTCYLTGGSGVEFSAIRLHYRGVDEICRAFGAAALTVGTDIYFRREAFAPHTPEGLRLLAHEVAHVVQQHRRPVTAGPAEEREADAAADALLRGRRFDFGTAGFPAEPSGPDRCVVQRYMAWEHCMLGDLDPARLGAEHLDAQCAMLERLGRDPRDVDEERLRAEHPGAQTLRLPGSGLVVTLGELNVLPDYLAHPEEIENAPEAFLLPLIQSVRSLNIAELRRLAGSGSSRSSGFRPGPRPRLPGSLKYPRLRQLAEIGEVLEVDARPFPPGLVRGRAPGQQDPGDAVVHRMAGRCPHSLPRPARARRHDHEQAAVPARSRSLRPDSRRARRPGASALGSAGRGRGSDPGGPHRSQRGHREQRPGAS